MRRCFSRGNNSDDFFVALFAVGVGNEENQNSNREPQCLLSFFAFLHAVNLADCAGIVEDELGRLETYFVLREIPAILFFVPDESRCRTYKSVCAS